MILLTILGALCFALTALAVFFEYYSYTKENSYCAVTACCYECINDGARSKRVSIIDKKIEVLLA